ncbi:hypothetical protein V496_07139 [Pseudogymnoascus sp. VKM F-4515 (FW-2607)]|nr:hypothetical protein V496_07139 [Pseudogymnoascus sp. VKM F-4515 (FW-2607)]
MGFFTLDQRQGWMVHSKFTKGRLLFAANCLAGMSIFFFGYDQGMMGGVNQSPDYINLMKFGYVDDKGVPVVTDTLLQGGIMAVFYLGTLVGCLFGGYFGDKYGRINTIGLGAAWGIFGAALQCSAMNSNWMIGARLVNGIGTGILNGIVPPWASELSDYTTRGTFIAMEFTLNIFGVVVAYWLAYGVSFIDGGQSVFRWRFPIAFQIIPLLFLLGTCWAFPESPRWLSKVGRNDEALYILQRLRGTEEEDAGVAEAELNSIKSVIELEQHSEGTTYIQMFFGLKDGKLHTARRVQLVIWLQIIQCWTGIAGVTMYGPTIFHIAGFGPEKSQWISGLNNIFYMFSTLICVFTIDRIGRRWTLYWGSVGQGIAMFLVGGLSRGGLDARNSGNIDNANQWGAAAASMIYAYTFVFGATWLTVPWLYPAEIFPLQVRAKGNAWGVVGWSIGNATLTLVLPYIVNAINEKMFYIFGVVNVLSIPIVWALYPESNQRTLEEMNLLFAASAPWTWSAEKKFKELKEERDAAGLDDAKAADPARHVEENEILGLAGAVSLLVGLVGLGIIDGDPIAELQGIGSVVLGSPGDSCPGQYPGGNMCRAWIPVILVTRQVPPPLNPPLITGANRGIGLGIAECCLANGASKVYSIDYAEDVGDEFKVLSKVYPGQLFALKADVTKEQSISDAIDKVLEEAGGLHGVVVNAGRTNHKSALDFTTEEIEALFAVNLFGAFYTARVAARAFIKQNVKGSIVFTASMASYRPNKVVPSTPYGASKGGVRNMTHTLAMEWAQYGIRVNSVSPGLVKTAMTYWVEKQADWETQLKYYRGIPRLAEVQELGGAYVYLLSDSASYTTSIDIPVNGVIGIC